MADVVEIISKLGVDASGVFSELDKVKAKYGETTSEVRKQEDELQKLMKQEENLQKLRAQTNSPNVVVQFNNEIKKTQNEISKLTAQIKEQKKGLDDTGSSGKKLGDDLKKAFDGTKAISLRAQLKNLKAELAATDDDATFEKLSIEAGKLEDRIGDASNAARIFASDSKFEILGNALGNVGQKLLALDFDGALQGSKLLVKASQQITFKDALGGIKQVGQTLFNVGKALLTNPLFLIGAAIIAIIANFDKLKNSGGILGTIFKGIGKVIDFLIDSFEKFTDSIGLTDNAIKKLTESIIKSVDKQVEAIEKRYSRQIALAKANEKETDELEKSSLRKTLILLNFKIQAYERLKKRLGELSEDQQKDEDETFEKFKDIQNQLAIVTIEAEKRKQKEKEKSAKLSEDNAKKERDSLEELRRKVRDLQTQNKLDIIDDATVKGVQQKVEIIKGLINDQINDERIKRQESVKSRKGLAELEVLLAKEKTALLEKVEKESAEKIKAIQIQNLKDAAERGKSLAEIAIDNAELETNGVVESYSARIDVTTKYYNSLIEIAKKNGEDTVLLTAQRDNALLKLEKDHQKEIFELKNAELSEEERHILALLSIGGKNKAIQLATEIHFENERLRILKESGTATEAEIKAQNNKIEELNAELNKELEKQDKEKLQKGIDNVKTLVDVTLAGARQILDAEIKRTDSLISAQQRRVDEATRLAEKGNAQLLELEKKRLSDLNKEKEKFVRAQQALAVIELIANTAVTISKAAAEGGAGAAITVAAALAALIAGLAAARGIAGQAAFYSGGEFDGQGYTGDGNPREVSRAVGRKPYDYHKKEYIFNHQTTGKYLDHFRNIHNGKMDLNDTVRKAGLYDSLNVNGIDVQRDVYLRPLGNFGGDISALKGEMRDVVEAVKSQERLTLIIDENGISGIASRYIAKQKTINKLTR